MLSDLGDAALLFVGFLLGIYVVGFLWVAIGTYLRNVFEEPPKMQVPTRKKNAA